MNITGRYLNIRATYDELIPVVGKLFAVVISKSKILDPAVKDHLDYLSSKKNIGIDEVVISYPSGTFYRSLTNVTEHQELAFIARVILCSTLNDSDEDKYFLKLEITNPCLIKYNPSNKNDNFVLDGFCEVVHIFTKDNISKDEALSYRNAIADTLKKIDPTLENSDNSKLNKSNTSLPNNIFEVAIKKVFNPASKLFYEYITAPSYQKEAEILQEALLSHMQNSEEKSEGNTMLVPFSQIVERILKDKHQEEDLKHENSDVSETDEPDENDDASFNFDSLFDKENEGESCSSCFGEEEDDSENLDGDGYYQDYVRKHGKSTELSKYINFLNNLDTNKETKDEIAKEILHLSHERKNTSDYTSCINWLENVMALPWNVKESADFSIDIAKDIIEKSHYGMKDVKERIVEMLAVRKKNGTNNGAIICLVGPPGCGKTSIGKSIAEALGKKFTRFSVGSIHDETDIVGHRRTYVASAPGKIMNAIRSAGAKDPVMLIDEVDKAATRQGNPLSALLEVLDPEQNKNFQDVYFDFPYDLSKVVFILTANDMSEIPLPLLDRLEVIEVRGYSENEKVHIANEFLLPKLLKNAGLQPDELTIDDAALRDIIANYTMEEGVRNLERSLSKIVRKFILKQLTESQKPSSCITQKDVSNYLGVPLLDRSTEIKADKPGSSLGLSKSSVGGDVLRIEVVSTKGNGLLRQTGHLGEVLKESAEVAFTLLKSMYSKEPDADEFFKNNNFHLHLPEGAIQKDGPSAGSALFSAFYSLYKNTVIKPHLAMTGEINLLGEVTPIGGLREKLLGAKRNRVTEVIVPLGNKKDIDDLEMEVKDGLTIHTVSNINEVIAIAFPATKKKARPTTTSVKDEAVC